MSRHDLSGRVLLSAKRVGRMLGVEPETVIRWVAAGEFPRPVTLPGNDLRWHRWTVLAWSIARPEDGPKPKGKKV